jgi:hypothetical protein
MGDVITHGFEEPLAESGGMCLIVRHFLLAQACGFSHADDQLKDE